jgi:hypothetical protein
MELPPPPDSSTPPPGADSAADFANVPPPAPEADQHEADVLKRRKHFSWKKFGGEGFLVSVAFHLLLLIAGLFWIVSKWREPEKKVDETFASGAGGGAQGDKAKAFEHKMQQRQPMIVKTPSRIVSKSASASVSLPSTPTTSTASFASGLSAGGMSKGAGGGSGGGEGTGIGIGKGGGRNFVSLFGSRASGGRLVGYIYDFTQTREGKPNTFAKSYNPSNNMPWLSPEVTKFVEGGWKLQSLDKFFRGPVELGVHQILIPRSVDSAAPKAFEADGKMKGSAWIAVYRGKVRAPESGTIRFSGNADNYLAVRFNDKNVLQYDCGRPPSPVAQIPGLRIRTGIGKWVNVTKGEWYDMNVLIGDAGGLFSAVVYYERKGEEGKLLLFRTEDIPWDEVLALDKGDLPRNLSPDSPVWQCKSTATPIR